jgi:hypothetical protein
MDDMSCVSQVIQVLKIDFQNSSVKSFYTDIYILTFFTIVGMIESGIVSA